MKVYVLTSGVYSDYHIVGVLLDEDQAKIAAETISTRYDDVNVEEYDTDELKMIKPGYRYYTVYFAVSNHSVTNVVEYDYFDGLSKPYKLGWKETDWVVEVYAEDEEHAIKSASDKLNKYLAEKNGL